MIHGGILLRGLVAFPFSRVDVDDDRLDRILRALEKDGVNYEVFLDENGFITKITAENELEIEFTEITKNG